MENTLKLSPNPGLNHIQNKKSIKVTFYRHVIMLLSSMLHSIAVGNMTPAGVPLICVDINPAVVIKLSDRGSLESKGIVTDVGLFLQRLVACLHELSTGELTSHAST